MENGFPELGVHFPRFLLPDKDKVDLKKWAVVACDQYTSEEDYWKRVEEYVGDSPSTLRLTFPEVYLEKGKDGVITEGIFASMKNYEARGILKETEKKGAILVERTLRTGQVRRGLMLALDLEKYSFKEGSQSLIRATEKTIEARIPPRLTVRRNARIEIPHIIVLIDDAPSRDGERDLITSLAEDCSAQTPLYETELMEDSGRVKGYFIHEEEALNKIGLHLTALSEKFTDPKPALLFAVGDGNHSLATAKALWEELKVQGPTEEQASARYALVEVQNCHDPSLEFEPINRLIFGSAESILSDLRDWFESSGQGPVVITGEDDGLVLLSAGHEGRLISYVFRGKKGTIEIKNAKKILPVASMTDFLDHWLTKNVSARIDYVHETTAIDRFCTEQNSANIGFVFSPMNKSDLFRTVITEGVLPRKTFSMGRSYDKRFYFEARYIQKYL